MHTEMSRWRAMESCRLRHAARLGPGFFAPMLSLWKPTIQGPRMGKPLHRITAPSDCVSLKHVETLSFHVSPPAIDHPLSHPHGQTPAPVRYVLDLNLQAIYLAWFVNPIVSLVRGFQPPKLCRTLFIDHGMPCILPTSHHLGHDQRRSDPILCWLPKKCSIPTSNNDNWRSKCVSPHVWLVNHHLFMVKLMINNWIYNMNSNYSCWSFQPQHEELPYFGWLNVVIHKFFTMSQAERAV